MSPSDVSKIITDEIAGDWSRSNLHGLDLRKCLVTPERRLFWMLAITVRARCGWSWKRRRRTGAATRLSSTRQTDSSGLLFRASMTETCSSDIMAAFLRHLTGCNWRAIECAEGHGGTPHCINAPPRFWRS